MLDGLTSLQNVCGQVENPSSAFKTVFPAKAKYKGCSFCPLLKYHFLNQLDFLEEIYVPVPKTAGLF